jgi:hypothetical protein
MAVLTLTKMWINRLDTGEGVSGYTSADRDRTHVAHGEVRTYAGGRQRSISSAGEVSTFSFAMLDISATDVDTLRSWKKVAVVVRDHRGQKYFGVFFEVSVTEIKTAGYNVAISLKFVDTTEGV